jgi:hypothetical protein
MHTVERRDSRPIHLSGLTVSITPFKIQRPSEIQLPDALQTMDRSHGCVSFVCNFFFPS